MGGRGSSSHFVRAKIVAHNAVRRAKKMVGSSAYSRFHFKGPLIAGVNKCNLFAADAFNQSDPSIKPLLGTPDCGMLKLGIGRLREYSAKELYDGKALKFNLVKGPRIGDICTDGSHVGIVSGKGKTISASALTNKIVENDWGFRGNSGKPQPNVRFYRYNGR